jgi:hypothetical protein
MGGDGMEKRKRNIRSNIRRRYRNQRASTKEAVMNLLLKQLGVCIFIFLLIIILKLIPLEGAKEVVQNINQMIRYNMSWDEAVETVRNTAVYIPVVKNWVEDSKSNENQKEDDYSEQTQESEEIPTINIENSPQEEVLNQSEGIDSEEIFILEPDLGESEEATSP